MPIPTTGSAGPDEAPTDSSDKGHDDPAATIQHADHAARGIDRHLAWQAGVHGHPEQIGRGGAEG